ncbi:MAG: metallophosphoesterase [Alistipes sp.]|jgi:predicted MPP superfamily phosphohydrolase|nr:metallophosphoesterase [Alistipes sp.]
MFLLFAVSNLYVIFRLWRLIPASAPALRIAVVSICILLTVSFFVGMAARSWDIPVWAVSLFYRIGSDMIMIFLYLLLAFVLGDILRLVHLLPRGVMVANWTTSAWLAGFIAVVFTVGSIGYHNKRRVEIALEADIDRPLTVVAASDLHLGFGIGRGELSRWVDIINSEKPDAVLLAGDVIDTSVRPLWQGDYAAELRRLDAPWGVFAIPGNHEYISDIDSSIRFFTHAGITPLRDSIAVLAGGVVIVGRDDRPRDGRKTIEELTASLFDDQTTILLDHQPYRLDEAADAGIDLQISGHTHRGQIWPITWITDRMFECSHGHYQKGSTRYYITQGLGIWGGKLRIGSRSEYIVINITPRKHK